MYENKYTVHQIAQMLGISSSTVRQHAAKYEIGNRVGKRLLMFSENDYQFLLYRPGPGNPNFKKKNKK